MADNQGLKLANIDMLATIFSFILTTYQVSHCLFIPG